MLCLREKIVTHEAHVGAASLGSLTLGFAERRRSRLRTRLDDGREAALWLPRGTCLRDGDHLRDDTKTVVVAVHAALETLSVARGDDALVLLRAAYHLGNRHVPVEIEAHQVAYQHDHVLDAMVASLGLRVEVVEKTFEPEAGGYGTRAGHRHDHADHAH